MLLQSFIDHLPPGADIKSVSAPTLAKYHNHLPECLLELWQQHGFGHYGDGLIQLIDPDEYLDNLWGWLMLDEDMSRIPFAISCFGDIFYYRLLSDEGDEDIAFIDPHTSQTDVLTWSMEDFFNDWCCDDEVQASFFRKKDLQQVSDLQGKLQQNQIYFYTPALRLGGEPAIDKTQRGDARVQLDLLLQLALEA
ncbi:GAD-like domain-containing protein [Shewanella algae]|uniref:GAD-like domain-containing protein n=1 Tax=Shewanella algae TaxID=38313 RepID=UPI00118201F1|nr:GAD-like domain-containing protein [Shewanella algae]TVL15386.1 GAD-like protein [Shewanella algae]